jgi:formylglycine-generating enzyme required for sulfatase activity
MRYQIMPCGVSKYFELCTKPIPYRRNTRLLVGFALALTTTTFTAVKAQEVPSDMVLVPAGEFRMGTNDAEQPTENKPRLTADATPQHTVTLGAFYLDKTEVTNAAYKKYCDATKYPLPPHWKNGNFPAGEDEFPVTHINWWEAKAYAAWVGKRLPTEAEWEKAARGTDARVYPWGNDWDRSRVVWGAKRPDRVASRPSGASPFGALDLAGNVFEWTESWYEAYPKSPHQFAEFGKQLKVIRGGAFEGMENLARTFYRSVARPQTRSEWVGFRCAKSVTP